MTSRDAAYWLDKAPVLLESMGAQLGVSASAVAGTLAEVATSAEGSMLHDDAILKGFIAAWIVVEEEG